MKKILAILFALIFVLSCFAACGGDKSKDDSKAADSGEVTKTKTKTKNKDKEDKEDAEEDDKEDEEETTKKKSKKDDAEEEDEDEEETTKKKSKKDDAEEEEETTKKKSKKNKQNDEDEEKTAEKLVVASSCDYPPYEYVDDAGEYAGIDIDIVKGFCKEYGYELSIVNTPFADVISSVINKDADFAISGIVINEERKQRIKFSDPYTEDNQLIVVMDDSDIATKGDLSGKIIGVQTGTTADDCVTCDFEDDPNTTVMYYDTHPDAANALFIGEVDCIIIEEQLFNSISAEHTGIAALDTPYFTEEYAAVFRPDDTELSKQFNKYLKEIKGNGTLEKICDRYLSE